MLLILGKKGGSRMHMSASEQDGRLQADVRELLVRSNGPSCEAVGATLEEPGRWWKALAEFGVFSLPVLEEDGGLGLTLVESVLAFEEMGRALGWGPLIWTQLATLA